MRAGMKKILKTNLLLFLILLIFSCSSLKKTNTEQIQLRFLDEYIVPENIMINKTLVGGLSGIDYYNGIYYLVCDDASNPRYYTAIIDINHKKMDNITFNKVIKIKDSTHYLDLEAIRYNPTNNKIMITSEGSISRQKDPSLFSVNSIGSIDSFFEIPKEFKATSSQKPRNNGTLEGLSISNDKKGVWMAMELPLEIDGPEPKITTTKSPIRITYIDNQTKKPTKQFTFLLDKIDKKPLSDFAVNGLTDILEYRLNQFFVIERSYSSGLGNQGNTIKIFNIDASKASNTLTNNNLLNSNYIPATKALLFDFESVRDLLTDKSIDNIEGITFGPKLENGNRTLILVADNNFNKLGKQLNQFMLLEILTNF